MEEKGSSAGAEQICRNQEEIDMRLYEVTFSPTGGTQKAADILAEALGGWAVPVDLTDSGADVSRIALTAEDLAVIAGPSYGGRVPGAAAERLGQLRGGGARAVLVCVYGNRAYEDTLVELEDAARAADFRVTAAVAAIAEHSIFREYAAGRPDEADRAQLQAFAGRILEKLSAGAEEAPRIPGCRPYKNAGGGGMVPEPGSGCGACGLCAEKCPVQAIDREDPRQVDKDRCISCMRCVRICPQAARTVDPVRMETVRTALKKVCSVRRENELYL